MRFAMKMKRSINDSRIEKLHFALCGTETASFGVAQALPGEEVDPLILRADVALYVAKKLGKNRVHFSEDKVEQI